MDAFFYLEGAEFFQQYKSENNYLFNVENRRNILMIKFVFTMFYQSSLFFYYSMEFILFTP